MASSQGILAVETDENGVVDLLPKVIEIIVLCKVAEMMKQEFLANVAQTWDGVTIDSIVGLNG